MAPSYMNRQESIESTKRGTGQAKAHQEAKAHQAEAEQLNRLATQETWQQRELSEPPSLLDH
jgi:hypothetical protein